jgi:archaellum component FlaF (FlaF/FlaG flagellin family)
MDTQHDFEKAMEIRETLDKKYYDSNIEISSVFQQSGKVIIHVNNTGKTVLNPNYLTVMINGTPYPISSEKVNGVRTNVWAPGEMVNITVSFGGNVERIKIVTQYGNFAYKVI